MKCAFLSGNVTANLFVVVLSAFALFIRWGFSLLREFGAFQLAKKSVEISSF